MALEKIRPRVVDATGNYIFNDVTLTGNVSSPTANIGNVTGVNNLVASSSTITVTGSLSTTANITAGNIKTNNLLYANGSPWAIGTTTTVSGSNSQVQFNDASSFGASANFTFDKTSNTLTVTNLVTNGSGITNITGSSVTGQVPNAQIAATVYTNSQPNITSVGTLSSLSVTGNIVTGNADLGNTATANYFVGSGNNLSNIQGSSITGAVAYATTANSVAGSNVSGAVTYAATANAVAGANVLGQVANATVASTVYTNAQPNITSVGTLTSLGVTGNITSGNAVIANFFTGNGSELSALTFGNITTFNTAGLTTDELYLQSTTRLNVTASGISGYVFDQYGAIVNPTIYVTSGQTIAFNLDVTSHPFLIQTSASANYSVGLVHVDTTGTVSTTSSAQGKIAGTLYWKIPYGITGNYKYQCSAHGGMNGNIVVTDANIANITVGLATFATTANAVAGSNVSGEVSFAATANAVAGANVSGEVSFATTANAVTGANVSGQVANALVAATVYTNAQPNITSVGILTDLTVSGNTALSGANVSLGAVGNLKITGGTSGYVLQTDGSGTLSWAAQSGGSSANISNGNSNVNIPSANGNINFSTVGNANVVVITGTGANINGYANISGNLTAGNISTSGITTLGNIGNVKISGGSANFTLQTDGLGNLSWAVPSVTSVGDVTVDNFTGNGSQTAYTLSVTPGNVKYVSVNIDGVSQLRQAYTVSGTTLTFGGAPANGALIEVTTIISGQVASANTATTVTASSQPNITSVGTLANLSIAGNITGNLLPSANITYDLGSSTQRWKDLYLSNSTIYLGDTPFSTANVFPFNLTIAPEVLTIQVAAPDAGDDTIWLWTWETSTLPYARSAITNSPQVSVPMYKQGTYVVNNFAGAVTYGNMTQTHGGHFKWIDGAGTQNLVDWAVDNGNVNVTHPNINGGVSTTVKRTTVTVPSTVTPPTLVQPSGGAYNVSFVSAGFYTITGDADGNNKNIGPLYRGSTYTFNLAASLANHPFYLTTDNGTGFVANTYVGEYTTGVTGSRNNGSAGQTTLTFTVPNGAPDTLYYQCGVHSSMRGTITIKSLAVETNINGNYIIYFQHTHEGHKTPIEIRPIPSLVNQMCVVYDASVGKFVPQDMATYVENTPSFKNKIREVAGTATLVAGNDVVVVPSVSIVEDASYLPFVGNKNGDISYAEDSDTIYLWNGTQWRNTKAVTAAPVYVNLNMPGSITAPFTGVARYYPINTILITTVYANLGTAPSGNFTFLIKKNGVSIGTTFTMSGVVMTPVTVNVSLTTSDYLTLDITGVNGSDLSIKLKYAY